MMARYQKHSRIATSGRIHPPAHSLRFARAARPGRLTGNPTDHTSLSRITTLLDAQHPLPDTGNLVTGNRTAADSPPHSRTRLRLVWRWLLALLFLLGMLPIAQPAQASDLGAPAAQVVAGASPQRYLLPLDPATSNVALETHIANLRVVDDANGPYVVVDATYRLRNPADTAVNLPLRIFAGGDPSLEPIQGLSLTQGDQPMVLSVNPDGFVVSDVNIEAEGRVTLNLRYQTPLGSGGLAILRYAPSILNQWTGNVSLRVEMVVPESIPPESWVQTTPDEWEYDFIADGTVNGLRWLYDFTIPETPFRLQFISPTTWNRLRALEGSIGVNSAAGEFLQLGNLYADLMRLANNSEVRERFYAQAVAAYTGGLSSAAFALASAQEKAALYIGLGDLYRRRLIEANAAEQTVYAELLVDAADKALTQLPPDHARRTELAQWQADGLQILLNQARTQRDWPRALQLLDRLEQLPGSPVSPDRIAEERSTILVQQALVLMEQGNREAALAVAGDQISAAELTPPVEAATLFTGWHVTVTVEMVGSEQVMRLITTGLTTPDRWDEARTALNQVVELWRQGTSTTGAAATADYDFAVVDVPATPTTPPGVQLTIDFPPAANGFLLARLLPPRADYALLQSLLTQLAPTAQRENGLIWQQIIMRQPIDLAPAVNQWEAIAVGLEEQAAAFDSQSSAITNANTDANADDAAAALQARVQAVNYRTAAAAWRRLARQSRLHFSFAVDDPLYARLHGEAPSRAWYITAESPSQSFVYQVQVLNLSRLLPALILAAIVLFGITSLLWGLL